MANYSLTNKIFIPSFTQGDSVKWETVLSDYPSDIWSLSWAIRGSNSLDLSAIAGATPSNFTTTISTTESSGLSPGLYYWNAIVSQGTERITLATGEVSVLQDLSATTAPYDGRTSAEKLLETVNDAISSLAGNQVESYEIRERKMTYTQDSLPELITLRDQLRIEVDREKKAELIKQGLGDGRVVQTRFLR